MPINLQSVGGIKGGPIEEHEIDLAYHDRDMPRANARRLRAALEEKTKEVEELRVALQRIVNWKVDKEHWQDIAHRALEAKP